MTFGANADLNGDDLDMQKDGCEECGRPMSLKDVEENTYREVDGLLLCPECRLTKAHPKRMRCPHCGEQVTAVLHAGRYTCARCGRQIGGQQEEGVIRSAQPAGRRGDEEKNGDQPNEQPGTRDPIRPRTSLRTRRKKSRAVPVLGVLLSCFAAATLILGSLLVRETMLSPTERPEEPAAEAPTDRPEEPTTEEEEPPVRRTRPTTRRDEEIATFIRDWIEDEPSQPLEKIDIYREAGREISDPILRARTLEVLADFEIAAKRTAAERERQIEELTEQLEEAAGRIAELEQRLETEPEPVETVEDIEEIDELEPEPTPTTREQEAAEALEAAKAAAIEHIENKDYGTAMATMQAVADEFEGTEAAEKATEERRRIRRDASDALNNILADARELRRAEDYAGARELLETARQFGVDGFQDQIDREMADLRPDREDEAEEEERPARTPAHVRELIRQLEDDDAAERSRAAERLGALGDRAAISPLIAALEDDHWTVRAAAAGSLGRLEDQRAVPHLIALLDDPQEGVVYDALSGLERLTGQKFAADEKDQWLEWYEENQEGGVTFDSTVRHREPGERIIGLSVPSTVAVPLGSKLEIFRDGERITELEVESKRNGLLYGRIGRELELELGATLQVRLIE